MWTSTGNNFAPGRLYELEYEARDKRAQLDAIFTPSTFEGVPITSPDSGGGTRVRVREVLTRLGALARRLKGYGVRRAVAHGSGR
jgi:hypothetical protein